MEMYVQHQAMFARVGVLHVWVSVDFTDGSMSGE